MPDSMSICTVVVLAATLYMVPALVRVWKQSSRLSSIPSVGPSGMLSSYIGAFRFIFHARDIIQEGYDKYYGMPFRVPLLQQWIIIASGPQMIEDIRKASDDELSTSEAFNEIFQIIFTMGPEVHAEHWHVGTVRGPLTRNLAARFGDIQDEISAAFNDHVPAKQDGWLKVPAYKTVTKIVCRTSNRLFVGLPLCRDSNYRALNEQYTIDVVKGSQIINLFPDFLKSIVAPYVAKLSANTKQGLRHLEPVFRHRIEMEQRYGPNWPDKPNDLISWLLDDSRGKDRSIRDLTMRVLALNFAAIHTTSMGYTHALYDLATYPEIVGPLREEVETVIQAEGWTKDAMGKLHKLDSFMKESQRYNGVGASIMGRKVLKDFTFSNGTVVPAGNVVAVASYATHHDEMNYANPETFDAFRFFNMRAEDKESVKSQFVPLGLDWVTFGTGRHACPGRFFAANELKAMLAHTLLNYDVKFEDEGVRPPNFWFAAQCAPNQKAEVMFRRRSTA